MCEDDFAVCTTVMGVATMGSLGLRRCLFAPAVLSDSTSFWLRCPTGGAAMRFVAFTTQRAVNDRILDRVGLPARGGAGCPGGPRAPPRAKPLVRASARRPKRAQLARPSLTRPRRP